MLDQQELQRKSEKLKQHKIRIIKQNIINSLAKLKLPYEIEHIIFDYAFDESKIETNNSLKEKIKNYYNTENEHLIKELDVSCVTSMYELFYNCRKFNLSLDNWDTSNVVDMNCMFCYCESFNQSMTLNTSNVTNMNGMFMWCKRFNQQVEINTSNVTDMSGMFGCCYTFNQPINFDTLKVTNMSYMLYDCCNFNQPMIFDTSKVTDMSHMFSGCNSLEEKNKQLIMC
jgi:surface protein